MAVHPPSLIAGTAKLKECLSSGSIIHTSSQNIHKKRDKMR